MVLSQHILGLNSCAKKFHAALSIIYIRCLLPVANSSSHKTDLGSQLSYIVGKLLQFFFFLFCFDYCFILLSVIESSLMVFSLILVKCMGFMIFIFIVSLVSDMFIFIFFYCIDWKTLVQVISLWHTCLRISVIRRTGRS